MSIRGTGTGRGVLPAPYSFGGRRPSSPFGPPYLLTLCNVVLPYREGYPARESDETEEIA